MSEPPSISHAPDVDPWRQDDRLRYAAARERAGSPEAEIGRPARRSVALPLLILLGVGAVSGVAAALMTQPRLMSEVFDRASRPDEASAQRAGLGIQVEPVAAPLQEPAKATPLEVLPPDVAKSTPAPTPANLMPPPPPPPPLPPLPRVAAQPPPVVRAAPTVTPAAAAPPMVAPQEERADNSLTCRTINGEATDCGDPGLTSAERRLDRSYQRALAAGASPRRLAQSQDRWLEFRDAAARDSRRAVLSEYEERIVELDAIAEEASEDRRGQYRPGD